MRPTVCALFLLATSSSLRAQDPDKVVELSLTELLNIKVTSASKFEQGAGEAPATVVVVTAAQIRNRNYRSLLDLLKDLPDVKVDVRSDPEWFNNITVRGVPGHDKFIILLDGMRISGPTNEQLPIVENYPIHQAKQVEIVYGPASALYGADAVSGVVNIISRQPENSGDAEVLLGDDQLRLGQFLWGSKLGDVRITLAGQAFQDGQPALDRDYPEYRDFQGQRSNSFQSAFGPLTASNFDRDPSQKSRASALYGTLQIEDFSLRIFHNSSKLSSSSVYSPDNAIYNDDVFIGTELTTANATYAKQLGSLRLESSLTAARYQVDPDSNFRNVFTGLRRGYKYAESGAFTVEQQATWTPSKRLTLTGGIVYQVYHATPWSTDLNSPVDPSRSIAGTILGTQIPADFFTLNYTNTGGYVQGQASVGGGLTLTAGVRYDDSSRYGSTTNPRLGLVWSFGRAGTLKALYGSAYLAPSPYQAYAHFGSFFSTDNGQTYRSSFWRLPNPDLRPIKSDTFELSHRVPVNDSFSVSLLGYLTYLRNLFDLVKDGTDTHLYDGTYKGWPVDYIEVRTNLGKQRNYGGTLRLDYLYNLGGERSLVASAAYSVVDGRVDRLENGTEIQIGGVTPSMLRLGADLTMDRWSASVWLTAAGRQRMEAIDPATNERYTLGGYALLDLALRARVWRKFQVLATVTNVLDARYRNVVETATSPQDPLFFGSPQDGRRFSAGVAASF